MESPALERGFADLGVASNFIRRLELRNIRRPTLIQEQVIPLLLAGKSLLFQSATGTGKTFAYLIPFFQSLLGGEPAGPPDSGLPGPFPGPPGPLMCVCAPTHALCAQLKGEADFLLAGLPLRTSLLIGSANPGRQIEGLKGKKP